MARIHELQKKVDKKFGELAVEMNFLTKQQLEHLLGTQKQWHLLLGQVLIDKDYMSMEQYQSALEEYKKEHSLSEKEFVEGNLEEIIKKTVSFKDSSLEKVFLDYVSLFTRSVIRFLGETPRLEANKKVPDYNAPYLISQEVYGPVNFHTALVADKIMIKEIAEKFAHNSFAEVNRWVKASVAEFLNLHNGIFLLNMSNNGMELELKPPETRENVSTTGMQKCYVLPVCLSSGKFDLLLSESPVT